MRVTCSELCVEFESAEGTVGALYNVTFETCPGEFLSIVGPSGSGKTTLLRVIAGLLRPQRGHVHCAERPLLVFQENNLFPWMTVLENSAFGLEMAGVPKRKRHALAEELLERFGIAGWEHSYPHQLSLGMKQRVAVIRAFLSNPSLLLMDEPFSALDVQTRMVLQQELLSLWEQSHQSVIFVTHDVDEAILLSDHVLVMGQRPGTIVAEFSIGFARPRHTSLTLEPEFVALKRRVWEKLGMEIRQGAALC